MHVDRDHLPWRLRAEQSGGGLFMDLASHALDILDYLLGPLEQVGGTAANRASPYEVEDVVAMHGRFASGTLLTGAWNFASALHEDWLDFIGTAGRLTLPVFGTEPLRLETAAGVETFDIPNPPHIEQPLIQSIVDQLHGRGQCPSTGATALRTAWVMDQVLADYYGTRDDDFWTRSETWPGRR